MFSAIEGGQYGNNFLRKNEILIENFMCGQAE